MSRLRVASIVEGHGEVAAVPILLRRIWHELIGGEHVDVLRPIRQNRYRLSNNKDDVLANAVSLAANKLSDPSLTAASPLILILLDAEDDLYCELGPKLLQIAQNSRSDKNISCVIANVMYETWFVAAAESLSDYLELTGEIVPVDPEGQSLGKPWVKKRIKGVKYSETVDQPKLTAAMDLHQCRDRSPSFDKLCRELEKQARAEHEK